MPEDATPLPPAPERLQAVLARGARPYVTLKAATSLDGKVATAGGESQWITGEAARAHAHRLRAGRDGVVVGIGTVLADDPRLTVRLPGVAQQPARQPARVVLDSRARIPLAARCLADDGARRIVVCAEEAPEARLEALRERGVAVLRCEGVRPQPADYLPRLRAAGIASLLVEGGAQVLGSLIAQEAADEVFLYIAGCIIGGAEAPGWCAHPGVARLAQAPRLQLSAPFPVGEDVVVHGHFR